LFKSVGYDTAHWCASGTFLDTGNHVRFRAEISSVTIEPLEGVTVGATFKGEGCLLMLVGWLEGAKPFLEGVVSFSSEIKTIEREIKNLKCSDYRGSSNSCSCSHATDPDAIYNYVGDFSVT
jgi:hypothetical protein